MTFEIIATKEELEEIGISYDITGLDAEFIQSYWTGYYRVRVEHQSGDFTFINEFDIPKTMLKEKETCI